MVSARPDNAEQLFHRGQSGEAVVVQQPEEAGLAAVPIRRIDPTEDDRASDPRREQPGPEADGPGGVGNGVGPAQLLEEPQRRELVAISLDR